MISFKGEYEEALRVIRVARRKFLLFLPDFGAISYFWGGELLWPTEYKGGRMKIYYQWGGLLECHRALFGGGGSCKVYRDTAKICVILSEFSPLALETFTSRRKKKYHCVMRYNTFMCYLQLSRKPRPCSSQCAKTNWKPQETKQHHSTERDRNGNQLEALSSCNLRKKEKQMTNVALLPS